MDYLTDIELRRVLQVAYSHNLRHHLLILAAFWHGLRVSEIVGQNMDGLVPDKTIHPGMRGRDIQDRLVHVFRLKESRSTTHNLHIDSDPLFDERPLIELAKANLDQRLFPYSRQAVDKFVKKYARLAGILPSKAHIHAVGKHSIAMLIYAKTQDINSVADYLGHKDISSSLCYVRADATAKVQSVVNAMSFGTQAGLVAA